MVDKKYSELFLGKEAAKCMLCYKASCTAACPKNLAPDKFIRSVRFDNKSTAFKYLNKETCENCDAPCEKACSYYDEPIRIKEMALLGEKTPERAEKISLETEFCGLKCENPFFLSSSIVAGNYEMCVNALKAGWAGVVYKTIGFFVPKEVSPRFDATEKEGTPFIGFRNLEQISDKPLQENLETLRKLKRDFPTKIIVASIMGQDENEWEELSRLVTQAGVDIIECNFSCPQMTQSGLGSDVGINPELVSKYTAAVKRGTSLPVLAKMTPNITNMEVPAIAAVEAGADGIAAINTIKSISGLSIEKLMPPPHIFGKSAVSGYSGKAVKPIALRFINDMARHKDLKNIPLSGMGGIETWHDAAEFIALGCSNIQVTTAVMQYGYRIIDDLVSGLENYLYESGLSSVSELVGKALCNIVDADMLDRDTVEFPRFEKEKCVGCGRCYISCSDAGHQAIEFDTKQRKPVLNGLKCVGCQLCRLVCPAAAIGKTKRIKRMGKA
ncbi:MAG: NAD-dependent dihydropyrimidine dehydrogenase subunit PreA [Acutalibacteraceae bacterium]